MDNQNIAAVLQKVVADRSEATALVYKTGGRYRRFTFSELDRGRQDFAARLRGAGIGRSDRVMLMVRPSMEFIALTFALFSIGAVVILIDPGMGYRNLLRCIQSVKPDILIGIPKAVLFSRLFAGPFATVRKRICVGRGFGVLGESLAGLKPAMDGQDFAAATDDLAAIIFTTGSTGPPKGVRYTHGIFHAQLHLIKKYYGIGPGEVDQPAFPLFALFSTALGARAVLPDMDPSRPAQVNPKKFIRSLIDEQVTYSFGSPAIWNVVSRYCLDEKITLPVKKILMAGAPVSGELVERVAKIIPPDGEIHTPYGATESLPIASIEGREIMKDCWPLTGRGRGVCVGRPLPGITITIIPPVAGPIGDWQQVRELDSGEIGEIVVKGPVVTRAYDHNPAETQMAKIPDGDSFRHRMGDMGYFDTSGRLWFCGRKAHVVHTADGPMYSICCEGIFNTHPHVLRSALVGIGRPGKQIPVILVEKKKGVGEAKLLAELQKLAEEHVLTEKISTFFVHNGFPVDIRHNAKIFREKLALWAEKQSCGKGCDDGL